MDEPCTRIPPTRDGQRCCAAPRVTHRDRLPPARRTLHRSASRAARRDAPAVPSGGAPSTTRVHKGHRTSRRPLASLALYAGTGQFLASREGPFLAGPTRMTALHWWRQVSLRKAVERHSESSSKSRSLWPSTMCHQRGRRGMRTVRDRSVRRSLPLTEQPGRAPLRSHCRRRTRAPPRTPPPNARPSPSVLAKDFPTTAFAATRFQGNARLCAPNSATASRTPWRPSALPKSTLYPTPPWSRYTRLHGAPQPRSSTATGPLAATTSSS